MELVQLVSHQNQIYLISDKRMVRLKIPHFDKRLKFLDFGKIRASLLYYLNKIMEKGATEIIAVTESVASTQQISTITYHLKVEYPLLDELGNVRFSE